MHRHFTAQYFHLLSFLNQPQFQFTAELKSHDRQYFLCLVKVSQLVSRNLNLQLHLCLTLIALLCEYSKGWLFDCSVSQFCPTLHCIDCSMEDYREQSLLLAFITPGNL